MSPMSWRRFAQLFREELLDWTVMALESVILPPVGKGKFYGLNLTVKQVRVPDREFKPEDVKKYKATRPWPLGNLSIIAPHFTPMGSTHSGRSWSSARM